MKFAQYDTEKPMEELLNDVFKAAVGARDQPAIPLVPFAVLLVRLTRDAERTAKSVVRLTWVLLFFTAVLIVLAFPPAWKEARGLWLGEQHTSTR